MFSVNLEMTWRHMAQTAVLSVVRQVPHLDSTRSETNGNSLAFVPQEESYCLFTRWLCQEQKAELCLGFAADLIERSLRVCPLGITVFPAKCTANLSYRWKPSKPLREGCACAVDTTRAQWRCQQCKHALIHTIAITMTNESLPLFSPNVCLSTWEVDSHIWGHFVKHSVLDRSSF